MHPPYFLEAVLKRDRAVVLAGLLAVTALAWAYLGYLAWDMQRGSAGAQGLGMTLGAVQPWGVVDFASMFFMWAVMMVAMMVPTAAPMILTFTTVNRRRREQQRPFVPTSVFLAGYLVIWSGFALLATLSQWGLHQAALLSTMMGSVTPVLGGIILLAAGVFQWTPIKYACLNNCRTPLGFLMTDWREGAGGAWVMGARHGTFCLGCCWFLMGLMFVAGIMNLLWMGVVAAYILLEKAAPGGHWVGRAAGLALMGGGAWLIAGSLL